MNRRQTNKQRSGTAAILILTLMIPLLGLLAFSIDYGFLLYVRTDLQRAADQAALAATRDLLPDAHGNQDLDAARETVRGYIEMNLGDGFVVETNDIVIGRYDPKTIYSDTINLENDGILDTVRVTVRRDDSFSNNSISLYFARLIGHDEAELAATSTAVLQKAQFLGPETEVFPFAISEQAWRQIDQGEEINIYGDGQIEDEDGRNIPGNWGTVDIGPTSNSTAALSDQIVDGLSQNDLNSLHQQGVIATPDFIDASISIEINGDTGLSAGLRHAVEEVEGSMKIAPIYKNTSGKGGNLEYEITGWGAIIVGESNWRGSRNSNIMIQRAYTYDQNLYPQTDLAKTTEIIEGAYTTPVLVE